MILLEGPGIATPDDVHEPDIALPDEVRDEGKEGVAGQQLGVIVEPVGDHPGEVGNKKAQCRDPQEFDPPVVEYIFIIHSSWVRAIMPLSGVINKFLGNEGLLCSS